MSALAIGTEQKSIPGATQACIHRAATGLDEYHVNVSRLPLRDRSGRAFLRRRVAALRAERGGAPAMYHLLGRDGRVRIMTEKRARRAWL